MTVCDLANDSVWSTCAVRARVLQLPAEKRTVEGRTLITTCDVVGEPEPTIEWSRADLQHPYVLGPQPVRSRNPAFTLAVIVISSVGIIRMSDSYVSLVCMSLWPINP